VDLQAILFLAQIQEDTRTCDDQVAGIALGFGQGMSRRARAVQSVEEKIEQACSAVDAARDALAKANKEKSKLLWHLALEKITTGALPFNSMKEASPKFRTLWLMRSLLINAGEIGHCARKGHGSDPAAYSAVGDSQCPSFVI
jgi:hypothetical protein